MKIILHALNRLKYFITLDKIILQCIFNIQKTFGFRRDKSLIMFYIFLRIFLSFILSRDKGSNIASNFSKRNMKKSFFSKRKD